MGLFEHFPYTNFHDLNLNWILGKIKDIDSTVAGVHQAEDNAAASAAAAAASAEAAAGSAEAAAGSAEAAAESEQNAAASESAAAESAESAASAAMEAVGPALETVEDWDERLTAFIQQHSGPSGETVLYTAPNGVAYTGDLTLDEDPSTYMYLKIVWKHRNNICVQEFPADMINDMYLRDTLGVPGSGGGSDLYEIAQMVAKHTTGTTVQITSATVVDSAGYNSGPIDGTMDTGIVRIIGVKNVADTEVVDARVGADGTIYPTLEDRLNAEQNAHFELEGVEYVATDLSQPNALSTTTVTGAYAEIVNTTPKRLRLTPNEAYTSFVWTAAEDMDVYFDAEAISASGYMSIATLTNPSALVEDPAGNYYYSTTGDAPVRYRKSENNLPSESNPLSITSGQLVIVSYQSNLSIPNATILYIPVEQIYLSTNVKLHAEQVEPFLPDPVVSKYRVKKTATSFEIKNRNAKYYVNYYDDSTIRETLWRTNRCDIELNNGTYFTLWNNSDSDGVVQLDGENDFIGGYHGDEVQTLAHMYVDGVEVSASETFNEKDYESIVMMFTSNVYHCNTSDDADRVAFIRNKVLVFDENGYTVKNYWIAQEAVSYKLAYMGMLSVERYLSDGTTPLISGYYTNEDYVYKNNATATARSEKITDVHFVTPYGDASVSMKFPASMQNNRGHVQDFNTSSQQRLKAYLGFGYGTAIPLASGGIIQAESTIKI